MSGPCGATNEYVAAPDGSAATCCANGVAPLANVTANDTAPFGVAFAADTDTVEPPCTDAGGAADHASAGGGGGGGGAAVIAV